MLGNSEVAWFFYTPINRGINLVRSTLDFGLIQSNLVHFVHFSPIWIIRFYLVHFGHIWSILSTSVIFAYSVHFGPFWFYLVQSIGFIFILFNVVLFSPIRSYSVHLFYHYKKCVCVCVRIDIVRWTNPLAHCLMAHGAVDRMRVIPSALWTVTTSGLSVTWSLFLIYLSNALEEVAYRTISDGNREFQNWHTCSQSGTLFFQESSQRGPTCTKSNSTQS